MKRELLSIYNHRADMVILNITVEDIYYQVMAHFIEDEWVISALDTDTRLLRPHVLDCAGRLLSEQGYVVGNHKEKTPPQGPESLKRNELSAHYKKDSEGKDLIARWADRYDIETFRVLMWAMLEKYNDRLGKKDLPAKEVAKMADYAKRWAEVEAEDALR